MRLATALDYLRPCRWFEWLTFYDPVAHEERDKAAAHAVEAAEKTKRRIENPRISLIIESVDDMCEGFQERRRH
jgi:hypothetical protein